MGEYHANGYGGRRQPYTAAVMFSNAAIRGDSQVSQLFLLSLSVHVAQHHCLVLIVLCTNVPRQS